MLRARAAFVALVTASGSAMAQQQDAEATKTANVGFYSAVSAGMSLRSAVCGTMTVKSSTFSA